MVMSIEWLDINKADQRTPNSDARLVGRALNSRFDLFGSTPSLEALRLICSVWANNQGDRPWILSLQTHNRWAIRTRASVERVTPRRTGPASSQCVSKASATELVWHCRVTSERTLLESARRWFHDHWSRRVSVLAAAGDGEDVRDYRQCAGYQQRDGT